MKDLPVMKHVIGTVLVGSLLYFLPYGYRLLHSRVIIPQIASHVSAPDRVYTRSEYGNLIVHGLHIPYAVVVVRSNGLARSETYYSDDGTTVNAVYRGETLRERSIRFRGRLVTSLPAFLGLLFLVVVAARGALRQMPSQVPRWGWGRLEYGERLAAWYGLVLFVLSILFRTVGR